MLKDVVLPVTGEQMKILKNQNLEETFREFIHSHLRKFLKQYDLKVIY